MRRCLKKFLADDTSGQALVEFALIFPLQLVFTFGILQLLFLMIASLMTNYAAFRVARTAAVYQCEHNGGDEDAINAHGGVSQNQQANPPCLTAARVILSPLSFHNTTNATPLNVPGWGDLRGSGAAADKIFIDAKRRERTVTVTVTFYQELIFPFVDYFFALFKSNSRRIFGAGSAGGHWYFPLTGTAVMRAAPFDLQPGANVYEYEMPNN